MAQLIARGLAVGYGNTPVAQGLDFQINEGDFVSVVGANGAGKSTLIKTLVRLLPAVEGEIKYCESAASGVGYLPQVTNVQGDFPASVLEVVLSGRQAARGLRPFYGRLDRQAARKSLKRLGIEGLSKRCFRELSGGQQRRVLLARALCASGSFLFLDEPEAGLDLKAAAAMRGAVRTLNRDGVTVVSVSHDLSHALEDATSILHVGEVPFFGSAAEYLESDVGRAFATVEGGCNG